jgi:hypothetical protein
MENSIQFTQISSRSRLIFGSKQISRDEIGLIFVARNVAALFSSVSNQGVWSFSECTRHKCSTR